MSESVDRYDVQCYCGAVDVRYKPKGHLVMYTDYAALEKRAEAAENEIDHLKIQIQGLIAALDNERLISRRAEAKLAEMTPEQALNGQARFLGDKEPYYNRGWNDCRAATLHNIEGVTVKDWSPPISLEKAKGIISFWSEKGHGASCSGLTECALARKVIQHYEGE